MDTHLVLYTTWWYGHMGTHHIAHQIVMARQFMGGGGILFCCQLQKSYYERTMLRNEKLVAEASFYLAPAGMGKQISSGYLLVKFQHLLNLDFGINVHFALHLQNSLLKSIITSFTKMYLSLEIIAMSSPASTHHNLLSKMKTRTLSLSQWSVTWGYAYVKSHSQLFRDVYQICASSMHALWNLGYFSIRRSISIFRVAKGPLCTQLYTGGNNSLETDRAVGSLISCWPPDGPKCRHIILSSLAVDLLKRLCWSWRIWRFICGFRM